MKKIKILALILALTATKAFSQEARVSELLSRYRYKEAALELENLPEENITFNDKLLLAGVYEKLGRYREALSTYDNLLIEVSTSVELLMRKGRLHQTIKEPTKSLACFQKLIEIQSDNGYFYQLAGDIASTNANTISGAFSYYEKALEFNPLNEEVLYNLGNLYLEFRQAEAASKLAHQILSKDSLNGRMLLLDARAAYLLKDYRRCVVHTNRLLKMGDTVTQVVRLNALAEYHLGNYERAIYFLEQIKGEQKAEQVYFYLSMSHFRLNQLPEAEQYMQLALKESISPNLGDYYTQMGIVYEAEGKDKEAISMYKKAYELSRNENLLYRLGLISEDYYADIKVAEGYFEAYLKESDSTKTFYREYSQQRLDEIKSARFFKTDSI